MVFWTYILRCADGSYYTGHTDDLERRVAEHHSGAYRGYTFKRRPVELMWSDFVDTREAALEAELRIKGWSRAKKEAWIAKDWNRLKRAAQPPSERKARSQTVLPERSRGTNSSEDENVLSPERASATLGIVPRLRSGETDNFNPPPVIVLVRPQLAENIGKAARAMLNFGLTEMRLVSPRDGWPNPDAGPAASGANRVIAEAKLFETVSDAVADCTHIYATTVRKRGVIKPVVDPAEAAMLIRSQPGKSAILFGPERAGLETEDIALARTILTVPVNPEFGSLNLAQAVILVAYEWSRGEELPQPPRVDLAPPASQFELDGLVEQLDAMLDRNGFYFPPAKVPTIRRSIRSILTKAGWSDQEVRTLRGVFTAIEKPHPKS